MNLVSVKFNILQKNTAIRNGGGENEVTVNGQEGLLLRLLLLHDGQPVAIDSIAVHLTHGKPVGPGSVPGYVARLKKDVGADRIRYAGGYVAVA